MPDVSVFQLCSQQINAKDKTAQQAATKADNALQKIEEVAYLTRVDVSYQDATKTITITTSNYTVS